MDGSISSSIHPAAMDMRPALNRILEIQSDTGRIDWFEGGPWDPWNHTESAMALCAMGEHVAAAQAYDYLAQSQRADGAWLGEYGNARAMQDRNYISREPAPSFLDSNFCAYPAVGIAHYYQVTKDLERVRGWWPMIVSALDFVLTLQRRDGTISWSAEAWQTDADDALLAGNASILKSLECGLFLARLFDDPRHDWQVAHRALLTALRTRQSLFDQRKTGHRFAMDWYYPVLSGALDAAAAPHRIDARWSTFVMPNIGCRCVSDEPWVTVAETAELALALLSIGADDRAADLLTCLHDVRDADGVFWMGWQATEEIYWPRERPSWTQAAVILAMDSLKRVSPGSQVLTQSLL